MSSVRTRLAARIAIVAIVIGAAAASAHAASKRSFVVDVQPPGWRADALANALASDLTDDQLAPVTGTATAELAVHVQLGPAVIAFECDARWAGGPAPVHGSIANGADRVTVASVLRDRLHRMARTSTDATAETTAGIALPSAGALLLALIAIAISLFAPFLLALRPVRGIADTPGGTILGHRDVRRVAARTAIGFGLGVVAMVAGSIAGRANSSGAVFAAGGLAWGAVLAATLPAVAPPLVGLGRADYAELGPVLRAWLGAAGVRALAIALAYVAIGAAVFFVCGGDTIAIALAVPVALLVARASVRTASALATVRLDAALADPDANVTAWDAAARGYLVGYFRRNGIAVDAVTLERVTILPGRGERVECYGGGLVASRIVVPLRVLELALAPWGRPHDYAAPRVSTLHWTQWNAGLVVPTEPGAKSASDDDRQIHHVADDGEYEREPLGEPPTLAGIIEPEDLDPRKQYRPHEDPLWLDWDPGNEHDGTDAGDRDFLFGALVRALGDIYRGADRIRALALLASGARPLSGGPPRRLAHVLAIAGAPERALGLVQAALLGARHHLVQQIAFASWQREDLVTARAYAPELEATARQILTTLLALPDAAWVAGPGIEGARELAVLAPLVRGAPRRTRRTWRRFAVAGALAIGAGVAVFAVVDAVRYHATYQQRMEKP